MPDLYEIIYVSRRKPEVTDAHVVDKIVLPSGRTNRRLDITGCLWFDKHRFLQVLEGPQPAVEQIYANIERDTRHTEVELLRRGPLASRSFGRWGMCSVTGESRETIADLAAIYSGRTTKLPDSPAWRADQVRFKELADRIRARLVRLTGNRPDSKAVNGG